MTIRCFRWDDAGAPQLGAASSLSVVLEKCLVDGYGAQAGLGWGKIKSPSGNIIAFQPRARAASRPWLAFDDRCLASMYGADLRGSAPMALFETLTGLADDGSAMQGSVNVATFSKACYLSYRRNDSVILPWLLFADSELDYFYLLLPMSGDVANGGLAGTLGNMTSDVKRRDVAFNIVAFGSVPGSMIRGDTGAFIWPGAAPVNSYASTGSPQYAGSNVQLLLAGASGDMYQFYKNANGMLPSPKIAFCNSPLMSDPALGGTMPLFSAPNPFANSLVLVPVDLRLYCADAKLFRGKLGGLVCSLNDRGAWRYGVDNCGAALSQNVLGSARQLLPVLATNTRISDTAKPTVNQANYVFFDLTGPW